MAEENRKELKITDDHENLAAGIAALQGAGELLVRAQEFETAGNVRELHDSAKIILEERVAGQNDMDIHELRKNHSHEILDLVSRNGMGRAHQIFDDKLKENARIDAIIAQASNPSLLEEQAGVPDDKERASEKSTAGKLMDRRKMLVSGLLLGGGIAAGKEVTTDAYSGIAALMGKKTALSKSQQTALDALEGALEQAADGQGKAQFQLGDFTLNVERTRGKGRGGRG